MKVSFSELCMNRSTHSPESNRLLSDSDDARNDGDVLT